jgi:RNA polymerase sigma-70 factor (ECF subfamily)
VNEREAPEVIARLVSNHREFLGFLEARVGDRALAEDILQEAFVRGLAKADSLRDSESATAWFYRMLRNAIIDHARRKKSRSKNLEAFAAELEATDDSSELKGQACQCISRLADTLKPEYAEALRRIEVEGMSVKDFAVHAGISSSNAGVRIFRAREALRQQLARSCGTCAAHGCVDCSCSSACH